MENRHQPLYGVLLILLSGMLLASHDGLSKHLTQLYPVFLVVWARYLFHLIAMLPLVLMRYKPRQLVPRRAGLQLLRGTMLLAGTALFFGGLAQLPQATVLALFFVSPLVVTVLAPLLLGERVGVWRVVAVAVGSETRNTTITSMGMTTTTKANTRNDRR